MRERNTSTSSTQRGGEGRISGQTGSGRTLGVRYAWSPPKHATDANRSLAPLKCGTQARRTSPVSYTGNIHLALLLPQSCRKSCLDSIGPTSGNGATFPQSHTPHWLCFTRNLSTVFIQPRNRSAARPLVNRCASY